MAILESLGLVKATPWVATTAGKLTVAGAAVISGVVAHRVYTRERIVKDADEVIDEMTKLQKEMDALQAKTDEAFVAFKNASEEMKTARRKGKRTIKAIKHDVRGKLAQGGIGIWMRKGDPQKVLATPAKASSKK